MTPTGSDRGSGLRRLVEQSLKFVLDRTLIRLLRYIDSRLHPHGEPYDEVVTLVKQRAAATSVDYIETHLDRAMLFATREQVWDYAVSKTRVDGLFAEFGVFTGGSINHLARSLKDRKITLYGFDSFQGLKEDWRGTWHAAGHFDLGGKPPEVAPNVTLIKGWFDDTLPAFLDSHSNEPFSFIHFDADTFEATSTVLSLLKDRIVKGTVIVFDEYLGFPNWQKGEFLAWRNFVEAESLDYCYLAFSNTPAALMVL